MVKLINLNPDGKLCSLLMKKFNVQRKDVVFDSKTRAKGYGIMTIYPVLLSYKDHMWHAVDITPENHENALITRPDIHRDTSDVRVDSLLLAQRQKNFQNLEGFFLITVDKFYESFHDQKENSAGACLKTTPERLMAKTYQKTYQ